MPGVVLLLIESVWLILLPESGVAPITLPVIVPTVQVKFEGELEVKLILVLVPLHTLAVAGVVTLGDGITVTVIV